MATFPEKTAGTLKVVQPETCVPMWYPMGAGGMWLNYFIWCSLNNQVLDGEFKHFEYPDLYPFITTNRYPVYVCMHIHSGDDIVPNDYDLRLGSNRAWMNFYLNVLAKKGQSPGVLDGCHAFYDWSNQGIDFNLDWCLIFEEPALFIYQLNMITNYGVRYNNFTKRAIEQYTNSCVWVDIDSAEFQLDARYKDWHRYALKNLTDRKLTFQQRIAQAHEVLHDYYYSPKK